MHEFSCRLMTGSLSCLSTTLASQLWEVQIGLRRAFVERANSVIIETYNMANFGAIQSAHLNQNPEVADLMHQIRTRLRDPNWNCSFTFVYSERNRLAEYLALLGGELFCMLYFFDEPIGRMGETMDLDMGLGPLNPQFLEAPMVEEEQKAFDEILKEGGGTWQQLLWKKWLSTVLGVEMRSRRMFDVCS